MPNTYTQLYVQLVFAVKHRESLIGENIRVDIQKYITGIVSNRKHKMMAIYIMPDHCHILVGLNPMQSVSDLVRTIKSNSSKWINETKLLKKRFQWQEGYGAFTYSEGQTPSVIKYVLNQKEHHRKVRFKEEYLDFLEKFNIDHDEKYLFDWIS
ncbi:IS200/IS605 family transposase [Roseivirga sp. E12]|uniref:IS200/IS605 family transposase n=1 Tax=Roseivirga sp. E12 TaxID=2819237 RepID=UPI001ABCDBAD|nr:IS200/IS605 family transposase [Roseivirga sp. E12]MBO3697469.1 IS200/IS605 family transposase [Roseivirga sp. E12]